MIEDMSYFSAFDFWDENASTSIVPSPDEVDVLEDEHHEQEEPEDK